MQMNKVAELFLSAFARPMWRPSDRGGVKRARSAEEYQRRIAAAQAKRDRRRNRNLMLLAKQQGAVRTERVLTPEAEKLASDFYREYRDGNCSCHISPPCGSCTHPGNPRNLAEDEHAWMDVLA